MSETAENVHPFRRTAEEAVKDLEVPVLSEDHIAREFVNRHVDRVRFDHTAGQWRILNDGGRWAVDETRTVFSWARNVVAGTASDQPKAERRRLGSKKFADGVEGLARADQRIAATHKLWDQDIQIIGTPNGIVDLETGDFCEPAPLAFITRAVAVDPDITIDCPRWLRFLNEITGNDGAMKRFLQQWAGYCLTGETREHKLVFIHGPGGTSKSTFANVLQRVMADYAIASAIQP
jgi:putative DNA primase/helicase